MDTDIQGTIQKDAGKSSHISQRHAQKIELHKTIVIVGYKATAILVPL